MFAPRFIPASVAEYPNYYLRPQSCEVCSSRENLILCENCQVTYYCSQAHKNVDFERHNEKCCYMGVDWNLPDADENETHQHMLCRVDILLHLFPNIEAAKVSLSHLLKANKSWRHPWREYDEAVERLYMTIREIIPVVRFRLGQESAAYKFIYEGTLKRSVGPIIAVTEDTGQRALELKSVESRADCSVEELETVSEARRNFEELQRRASLGHQVLLTLMTIKALRYFQDVQNASTALFGMFVKGNAIPQETIDNICGNWNPKFLDNLFGFDSKKEIEDASWRQRMISELRWLVAYGVREASRRNKHIWRLMLDTDRIAAPGEFGHFSPEVGWDVEKMAEVVAVRQYQAWKETPGSFNILRKAVAAAASWDFWGEEEVYIWTARRKTKNGP